MKSSSDVLSLSSITKRFGDILACDHVDFNVPEGSIVGLLGQNGAGKSTLMNIVIGLYQPDAGSVSVQGNQVKIRSPKHAAELGVSMVHQHFSVIEALSVWESVCLGDKSSYDPDSVKDQIFSLAEKYGLGVDPNSRISELTPGQRQRVEILKCLRRDPKVLILDEPTSVLTDEESVKLFDVVQRVVEDEGRAAVLISHKLDEILYATQQIVIMRDGQVIEKIPTENAEAGFLAEAMVGRKVSLRSSASAFGITETDDYQLDEKSVEKDNFASLVLKVENSTCLDDRGRRLEGFNLEASAGEIVGVTGAEGNGQALLADVLSSLVSLNEGAISVDGKIVKTGVPGAMSEAGIAVIPEDRHHSGCALELTVAENLIVNRAKQLSNWGIIRKENRDSFVNDLINKYDVKASSPEQIFGNLSGGNQQKCVVARELSANPKILVAVQPTRGLDVGAIEFMVAQIKSASDNGVAVILISTEISEVLELSDRLIVMYKGRNQLELSRKDFEVGAIGAAMAGES